MSSIPVRAESCSEKGVPSGKGSDANPGSFLLRERGSSGLFVFLLLRFFGRVFCRGCRGCPVRSVVRFVFSFACPASRLSDFSPVRLLACPASRLFGFSPVRLLACSASRLSGFLSVLLLRLSHLSGFPDFPGLSFFIRLSGFLGVSALRRCRPPFHFPYLSFVCFFGLSDNFS